MNVLWSAFYFLLGGIATALMRAGATRYLDRARPSVRILAVRTAPGTTARSAEISIDYDLIVKERDSPILPKLSPAMKIDDIKLYVKSARRALNAFVLMVAHLSALLARPHLLEAVADEREKRRLLLLE